MYFNYVRIKINVSVVIYFYFFFFFKVRYNRPIKKCAFFFYTHTVRRDKILYNRPYYNSLLFFFFLRYARQCTRYDQSEGKGRGGATFRISPVFNQNVNVFYFTFEKPKKFDSVLASDLVVKFSVANCIYG